MKVHRLEGVIPSGLETKGLAFLGWTHGVEEILLSPWYLLY
jgi:hypothetical protein